MSGVDGRDDGDGLGDLEASDLDDIEDLGALEAFEDFADLSEAAPGLDLGSLLASAQAMQQQLMEAQAELASQVVEGQAGGGAVKVRVTGGLQFEAVVIDPAAVDPDDVEMLEDLVLAAIRDGVARANALSQGAFGDLGALGGIPGLGELGFGPSPDA